MQQNEEGKHEVRKRKDTFISRDIFGNISWTTRNENIREIKKPQDIIMKISIPEYLCSQKLLNHIFVNSIQNSMSKPK